MTDLMDYTIIKELLSIKKIVSNDMKFIKASLNTSHFKNYKTLGIVQNKS